MPTNEPALIAEQTATIIIAQAIIDMTVQLARDMDDPRIVDAVLGTIDDKAGAMSHPFIMPGQTPLKGEAETRTVALAKQRVRQIMDLIKMACEQELATHTGPKN